MEDKNLPMQQTILAFGLTNIGCNQSDATFQTIIQSSKMANKESKFKSSPDKTTSSKKTSNLQPYTIKYNLKDEEHRNKRLQILYRYLLLLEWIDNCDLKDFIELFSGKVRYCNVRWTGPNQAVIYELLQKILEQPFVDEEENVSARSIARGQFGIKDIRSCPNRAKKNQKEINICLQILNPCASLPKIEELDVSSELNIKSVAQKAVYDGELTRLNGINRKVE